MDPFSLLVHDEFSVIRSFLNKTLIHDYGIISKDLGDGFIEVLSVQKKCGSINRISAKYLTFSSSLLSVSQPPQLGDLVLILSLQHLTDKMFSTDKPVDIYTPTGYGYNSCIAIPIGIFKEDAENTVSISEEGVKVSVKETLDVDAKEIHLNGDSKKLVTHAELDAALSSFVTQLGLTLASGANGGGPVVFAVPPPSSIDISAAASTTVKTGG